MDTGGRNMVMAGGSSPAEKVETAATATTASASAKGIWVPPGDSILFETA